MEDIERVSPIKVTRARQAKPLICCSVQTNAETIKKFALIHAYLRVVGAQSTTMEEVPW